MLAQLCQGGRCQIKYPCCQSMQWQLHSVQPPFGWLMMSGAGMFIGSVSFFDRVWISCASLHTLQHNNQLTGWVPWVKTFHLRRSKSFSIAQGNHNREHSSRDESGSGGRDLEIVKVYSEIWVSHHWSHWPYGSCSSTISYERLLNDEFASLPVDPEWYFVTNRIGLIWKTIRSRCGN